MASKFRPTSGSVFSVCGRLTMALASISTLAEMDFKRLIALSTLSQVGFLFLCFGLATIVGTAMHLFSHALIKSNLFMCVGFVIHSQSSQQDCRGLSFLSLPLIFMALVFILLLSLAGFWMTGGFVTKDLALEILCRRRVLVILDCSL